MFIVIEGLDGAGKSTQINRLRAYLQDLFCNLEYIHFPRYNAPVYGELISDFLKGKFGEIDKVHPQLVALLFAQDRADASKLINNSLRYNKAVLLDRYVYSNIAYQCAKLDTESEKEELKKWIINTEYNYFNLAKPQLNIFLDVPISFVESNLQKSREGQDRDYLKRGEQDIHEASISFQEKVRNMYLQLTEEDPDFIRLDCSDDNGNMLDEDTIFTKLKDIINAKWKSL